MNQAPAAQKPNVVSPENLLEKAFENDVFSQQAPVEAEDLVTHTEEHLKTIGNDWVEFMSKTTEVKENSVEKTQIVEMKEIRYSEAPRIFDQESKLDLKPVDVIEEQKGSGSWVEDAGFKLDFKSLFKGVFGFLGSVGKDMFKGVSLLIEASKDTVNFAIGKKDKKAEKVDPDQEKAKAAAEKKAEKQRKNANIRAFYEGLKASIGSVIAPEAARMEAQEKENINKTLKLTSTSYKGIKDSFGRLTIYAASMFEREQLDQEKQAKKVEKEQKMASVSKGPDLNMDKVAEGGFLSSTGGQGAG